jgi:hypothetical protein
MSKAILEILMESSLSDHFRPWFNVQYASSDSSAALLFLPLRRREALWRPRMNRSNLFLECSVDQPMPRKCHLLFELCRHDNCFEHLAAATCFHGVISKVTPATPPTFNDSLT